MNAYRNMDGREFRYTLHYAHDGEFIGAYHERAAVKFDAERTAKKVEALLMVLDWKRGTFRQIRP